MSDTIRRSLCEAVDGTVLMGHMQELARWIKLSGTSDERQSLRYFQAKLDEYGYRTQLIMHDAYISLPGKARVDVDNQTLTSITHSFSRSSPVNGVTGRLVYLGEGDAADFSGRDLKGAIVLMEGIASPAQAARASHAGAVGQVQISPHEHLHEMCVSPVWGSPSGETQSDLPTTVVCTVSNADGNALRERLVRGEQPKVTLHAEVDTGWRQTPILEAEIDGPGADSPFILYSGHHDTWYYGVMDNGAANATMLEVARLTARERTKWQRGLRLCFWSGHSHGRYSGSTWYVDQNWDELDRRCAVHVNVDSTGGVGATVLKNAAAAPELIALAADAIGEQAASDYAGKAHVTFVRSVILGRGHSRNVRRTQRATARAGENAQRAGMVVAYAARSAGQDRREESRARHPGLRAHALAPADRSGAATGLHQTCPGPSGRTRYSAYGTE
jgi:Iap family predicted aminopeptidase